MKTSEDIMNVIEKAAGVTALNKRNKALLKRFVKTLEIYEKDAQNAGEVYGDYEEGFKTINKKLEDSLEVMNKVIANFKG